VYRPDWSEPARLDYTLDLADLLAQLMPQDAARGSVSTLPLGRPEGWAPRARDRALRQLDVLATRLAAMEADSGRVVRVGLEPEPGCVVDNTADLARHLTTLDPNRIGICLDACHLAVSFEGPAAALRRIEQLGLSVVKLQASCAVEAADPAAPAVRDALAAFAEPRFLHQTRELGPDGVVARADDLPFALGPGPGALPAAGPWRVHFHVPLHADPAPPLTATRTVLEDTLLALLGGATARTDHVEVETYTWQVLPEDLRPVDDAALAAGIAAELRWAAARLAALGLTAVDR
jgi:hypothetical protein